MIKKILINLFFLNNLFCLRAQGINGEHPSLSFGLVAGFKSTNGGYGMCLNYEFKRIIEIDLGFAVHRFQGTGLATGLKGYLFKETTFRPYIGLNYLNTSGLIYNEVKDGSFLRYMSPPQQYIIPALGVRYNESAISILFSLNYQNVINYRGAYFVSGKQEDISIQENIDRINKGGLGFTIGFIFHWW